MTLDAGSVELQTDGANEDDGPLPGYEKPSIQAAKDFFQANLPHRIPDVSNTDLGYRMANRGETYDKVTGEQAELFPFWKSGLKDLDLFGIGIGLYFRQLMALGIACGTLCHSPNSAYASLSPSSYIPLSMGPPSRLSPFSIGFPSRPS